MPGVVGAENSTAASTWHYASDRHRCLLPTWTCSGNWPRNLNAFIRRTFLLGGPWTTPRSGAWMSFRHAQPRIS